MKAATIQDIKEELQQLTAKELVSHCLRLAKFKKDNKELLTYLLFESSNENEYVESVKVSVEELFETINTTSLYFVKKSLRKILRILSKHIRYTGSKSAEAALLLHFCATLQNSGIPFQQNNLLKKMYEQQLKKSAIAISALHEDLQYEFKKEWNRLSEI